MEVGLLIVPEKLPPRSPPLMCVAVPAVCAL